MSSEWANCDVMLTRPDTVADLGYEGLRIGDVVAMTGQDHRYGRGSLSGSCAIGIIAHGIGVIPATGPASSRSCPAPASGSCSTANRRERRHQPGASGMSGARANLEELVATAVVGAVTTPVMGENPYEVGADGTPFVPVGAGGICYNVKVGMAAMGWAADQVEPGVSISNPDPASNDALAVFACVGNPVAVRTGAAAGAVGDRRRKARVVPCLQARAGPPRRRRPRADRARRRAPGARVRPRDDVAGAPGIACHSLGPELWRAWAPAEADGASRSP